MEDALRDYQEAQIAGHHVDCDGFRTSHRVEIVRTEAGTFAPSCEECGWQTTGSFGEYATAKQFADLHTAEHGGEVPCDHRCLSWQ